MLKPSGRQKGLLNMGECTKGRLSALPLKRFWNPHAPQPPTKTKPNPKPRPLQGCPIYRKVCVLVCHWTTSNLILSLKQS